MKALVICEICGTSFSTSSECEICFNCLSKPSAKPLSRKALDSRNIAKILGGKALTGTAKQKEWAEKIRADKIRSMTTDQAVEVCKKTGLFNTSKFWIENRERTDIGVIAIRLKELREQFSLNKDQLTADEYNTITKDLFGV